MPTYEKKNCLFKHISLQLNKYVHFREQQKKN